MAMSFFYEEKPLHLLSIRLYKFWSFSSCPITIPTDFDPLPRVVLATRLFFELTTSQFRFCSTTPTGRCRFRIVLKMDKE